MEPNKSDQRCFKESGNTQSECDRSKCWSSRCCRHYTMIRAVNDGDDERREDVVAM